jgi:hypothetical protein
MAYKVAWYIEGRVLYIHGPDVLSLETISQINDDAIQYLDTGTSRIHLVVDARSVRVMPHNLVELRKVSRLMDHFLIGWIAVITSDPVVSFLASAIPQMLTRSHSRVVSDFDDAIAFLKETDPSIDWERVDETALAQ